MASRVRLSMRFAGLYLEKEGIYPDLMKQHLAPSFTRLLETKPVPPLTRDRERPVREPNKAHKIIWSSQAKATAGGTQN